MSQLALHVENDAIHFEPGDQAVVTAEWDLAKDVDAVELRLIWYTEGKGDSDQSVVESLRFENPPRRDSKRLGIQLPEAPYSFSGKLVSLIWCLELEAAGEIASLDIVVGPGKEEILLPKRTVQGGLFGEQDEEDDSDDDRTNDEQEWAQYRRTYETQGKLAAIQLYRDMTGDGLARAKEAIEEMAAEEGWKAP